MAIVRTKYNNDYQNNCVSLKCRIVPQLKRFLGGFIVSLLLGLQIVFTNYLSAQESGYKNIRNFSPQDYRAAEQNFTIVQDHRGVIYAANNSRLLEYDGVSWSNIDIPNKSVLSLVISAKGTLFIGGIDEFGTLEPGGDHTLKYSSLRGLLKDNTVQVSKVWFSHALQEGIYFNTSRYIFRWHAGKLYVIPPSEPLDAIGVSFDCQGKLYVRQKGIGLSQVTGNRMEILPGTGEFGSKSIAALLPYGSNSILICTKKNGLFIYDGIKSEPFDTEVSRYLIENELLHGLRLFDGHFALGTKYGGVVIIDARGGLIEYLNETVGLQNDQINYIYQDTGGNLWLALNYGISKIEYESPVSFYDKQSRLKGLVLSVARHRQNHLLYVGTSLGLYTLQPLENHRAPGEFRPVPGIGGFCRSILSIDDSLLVTTKTGVFLVGNSHGQNHKLIPTESFQLLHSRYNPDRVWVGTQERIMALEKQGNKWQKIYQTKPLIDGIRSIAEQNQNTLWLGTQAEGTVSVTFPPGNLTAKPIVAPYKESNKLPPGPVYVAWIAGHVIFATEKGLFRFDVENKLFIPDRIVGPGFAGGDKGSSVFRIVEDVNNNIWLHTLSENFRARPDNKGEYHLDEMEFAPIPRFQANAIYPEPSRDSAWFCTNGGLIHFSLKAKKRPVNSQTLIRGVTIDGKPYSMHNPIIPFKNKSFRFKFALPFFEKEQRTQYRYRLDGYDDRWSQWSSDPKKEYTHLGSGSYRFSVQGRDVYLRLGQEAHFPFQVLPPWYYTWIAFIAYFLAAGFIVLSIVKWRSGKLEREKKRLEHIVVKRTQEIHSKNQQLEAQTIQLKEQSEKLKEMDHVKSRFFANISHEFRTPLTLIMGPLEHMIAETNDQQQQWKMNLMLRNSQRLLGLINQLLELSKFESGAMKLRAAEQDIVPYLKGLSASFSPVAVANELELIFHAPEEPILIYFDQEKFEEVILNFLSNALKFTPPGGRITLSVAFNTQKEEGFPDGSLEISITDTGPGIPREQLIHIFDRFYQSDNTYEHHQKGSGIGLSIAKEVVELHRGKINVHSREGKGTQFIIRLPLGKSQLQPDELLATPQSFKPRQHEHPLRLDPLAKPEVTPESLPHAQQEVDPLNIDRNIILVVEDNSDLREFIRNSLESLYTVVEAVNGEEGIEKAQEMIPDLIISDIMMPGSDGHELCRRLKNNLETSHIPIVLLTAKASEEDIVQGLETGADDYITKPFNTKMLCTRIKNLIDLRRHMQQSFTSEMTLQPAKMSVSQMDKGFIKQLKKVLKENMADPDFNINQMCETIGLSQSTLYRKIHALTGVSPTEFIRSYRLRRGAELLKNGVGSVLEVALEVGFSSANYFTKCFKKKYHQLPSTYQAAQAQSSDS
jgi:signal transduction histidine kinase/DNA-binding NarL/FixJ family response regulator/ligand-binding sensor domain-containing protein